MLVQILPACLAGPQQWLLSNLFGQSYATDAFFAAFSIPILSYILMARHHRCFIPCFPPIWPKTSQSGLGAPAPFFSSWVLLLMVILLILGSSSQNRCFKMLTSSARQNGPAGGAGAHYHGAGVVYGHVGACTGVLQSQQHFTWPAIGVLLYNVFILVFGILLIRPSKALWPATACQLIRGRGHRLFCDAGGGRFRP